MSTARSGKSETKSTGKRKQPHTPVDRAEGPSKRKRAKTESSVSLVDLHIRIPAHKRVAREWLLEWLRRQRIPFVSVTIHGHEDQNYIKVAKQKSRDTRTQLWSYLEQLEFVPIGEAALTDVGFEEFVAFLASRNISFKHRRKDFPSRTDEFEVSRKYAPEASDKLRECVEEDCRRRWCQEGEADEEGRTDG